MGGGYITCRFTWCKYVLVVVVWWLLAIACTDLSPTSEPIPKTGYESWSLFLVCDDAWFVDADERVLQDLFGHS